MNSTRRTLVAILLALTCAARTAAAQAPAAAPAPTLTQEEMSNFLLKAEIGRTRSAGAGVTDSKRATLTYGPLTHDAHIQTVDEAKTIFQAGKKSETNFKDTYRFNVAAYRLSTLVGLRVPVSVERKVNGAMAAVTWWVDDVAMDEEGRNKSKTPLGPNPVRTTQQLSVMRAWDELIENKDRNQGNILWTKDWTMWLIDHTRAFRLNHKLTSPDRLTRIDRDMFTRLRGLTREAIEKAVGDSLKKDELSALVARREALVKHFEDRIARAGEANVFFSVN
jgi:hypothetical protein